MPKNTVTDPITGQEMAFAHLILSGTMNDRRAAEAVGLNPDTAAYTKSKPRVRAYMLEHRAAVREKLVDQEAEALRKLNIGRDKILNRLWELATLSHEATRGSISGQMKALAMIAAIEGLIPDRRLSRNQPVAPPADTDPADAVATPSPEPENPPQPAQKPANNSPSPTFDRNHLSVLNPFIDPAKASWAPAAADRIYDAVLDATNSLRLPFSSKTGIPSRRD